VVEAHERKTGITIHYVNENYDEGNIIEQHQCLISLSATPEYVQGRVLEMEHKYFAPCIERLVANIR
jgi:phosphoribosylglycinamide formyltransferase-1